MIEKKPYTVLLAYPAWMTDGGLQTYLAHAEADDATGAVVAAQKLCVEENSNGMDDEDCEPLYDYTEFDPLAVFEGHHNDVLF